MSAKKDGSLAAYYFHQGTNFAAYDYLGVHSRRTDGGFEYTFRVWAPNAFSVALTGDFNGWNTACKMERITDMGVW